MGSIFLPLSVASSPGLQPDQPASLFTSPKVADAGSSAGGMKFESLVSTFLDASHLDERLAPVALPPVVEEEKNEADLPYIWLTHALPPQESLETWTLFPFSPANPVKNEERPARQSAAEANSNIDDYQPPPPRTMETGTVAFEGTILDIAAPVASEEETTPSPQIEPSAAALPRRNASAPQDSESPALPVDEPIDGGTHEAGPGLHSAPAQLANMEPVAALEPEQAVAPTAQLEELEMPAAPKPSNGISVRLVDDAASSVHLRVAERGGELTFDVRATNSELAGTLRQELPELMKRLQSTGLQVEIRQPEAVLQTPAMNSSDMAWSGQESSNHRRRRESRPGQQRKPAANSKSAFSLLTQG
jgi:hypothetical protein